MNNRKACTDVVINNYLELSTAFFEGYRTPAAILTAAAMVAFFQVNRMYRAEGKKNTWEKFLTGQCHLSFFIAFILSGMVLLVSSTAQIHLLRQDQFMQSTAKSAYDFLMEEFPFEVLVTRWSFIVSIINCLRGVMIHIVLNHHLVRDEGKREQFISLITSAIAMVTCIFSYINSNLFSWNNFFDMTWDLLKIVWDETFGEKPLKIVSLFAAGISFGLYIKTNFVKDDKKKGTESGVKKEEDKTSPSAVEHNANVHVGSVKVKAEKHQ